MTKAEFLSGSKFSHKTYKTIIYQYEPSASGVAGGYLWQGLLPGYRTCVATFREIGENSFSIDIIILGNHMVITSNYSDFELC